eukprot:656414-Amphidinium_carterae.4
MVDRSVACRCESYRCLVWGRERRGEGQSSWDEDAESDVSETDSEQERYEDHYDHYSPERLDAEQTYAAQHPTYTAELFWTARKALRRHRAATGRLHHHRFQRHRRKGQGEARVSVISHRHSVVAVAARRARVKENPPGYASTTHKSPWRKVRQRRQVLPSRLGQ